MKDDSQILNNLTALDGYSRERGSRKSSHPTHNSNISGGAAFSMSDYNGGPIDEAYVKQGETNMEFEITQAKKDL